MYRKQQQHQQQQKRNYSNKRLCCQLVKNQPVDPILTKFNQYCQELTFDAHMQGHQVVLGSFAFRFLSPCFSFRSSSFFLFSLVDSIII